MVSAPSPAASRRGPESAARSVHESGTGLRTELQRVEAAVHAGGGEQLLVTAALDDAPAVEHQDLRRVLDRGQTVRDHEDRAPLDQTVDRALHQVLRLRV